MSIYGIMVDNISSSHDFLSSQPHVNIGLNVPNGYMAVAIKRILHEKIANTKKLLIILPDDLAVARMAQNLQFWQFIENKDFVIFPAWDCLPYDRVSPHHNIIAKRLAVLAQIKQAQPALIITTVNAFVQKIITPENLYHQSLKLGQNIPRMELLQLLERLGYRRSVTVRENCEYAIRGDIIDIFPAGSDKPIRLEFFDEQLDKMRFFDAVNQRTDKDTDLKKIDLISGSETPTGQGDIFKQNYLQLFGRLGDEYLLQAVKNDAHYQGKEHWLPLYFEEELVDLLAWLDEGTKLVIGDEFYHHLSIRLEMIADHYDERQEKMPKNSASLRKMQENNQTPYAPMPPEKLYLDKQAIDAQMIAFETILLSANQENLPHQKFFYDFGARKGADYRKDFQKGILFETLKTRLSSEAKKKRKIIIGCLSEGSRTRLTQMIEQYDMPVITSLPYYDDGVAIGISVLECASVEDDNIVLMSESDLLGQRVRKTHHRRKSVPDMLIELNSLNQGDYVVHAEHGIARYEGLKIIEVHEVSYECLHLAYANRASLYVPVENIDLLSRYGSAEMDNVKLDSLGLQHWQQRKARMKKHLLEIAGYLVDTAAKRQLKSAPTAQYDGNLWDQFCASFPYAETDDQLQVIADVTADLQKGIPMDRLVCGDAGFGKTEIALRAAFQIALSGRQVILIAPTTLLARQHYRLFRERFAHFEIKIVQLSRLVSAKDTTLIKEEIKDGTAQIIIGTHRILSKSISFNNPGLLIIDEEQHFGVKQKEQLKQWVDLHILTLSATPIPRSLNFALSGLRDLSLIATPPVDRLAVRSFITPYDEMILSEAIKRELLRGGQIFCVCPRISDLTRLEIMMRGLSPDMRLDVAHGQMPAQRLETAMQEFVDGRLDMLLSTNIVESGLDIPTANTIFIFRPDKFGLSQLYQLRGRVGRGRLRGYCYLILPSHIVTKQTMKRMEIMQSLDSVGAGFQVASYDLDLRGGGNLLGEAQSGKISEIGIELYHQMLREAINKVKGEEEQFTDEYSPQVKLDIAVMLPESYVEDLSLRMGLYQRLAKLKTFDEIDDFTAELADRFGIVPMETRNLLHVMKLRLLCRKVNVAVLEVGNKGLLISFRDNQFAAPEILMEWVFKNSHRISISKEQKLTIVEDMPHFEQRLKRAMQLLQRLQKMLPETSPV